MKHYAINSTDVIKVDAVIMLMRYSRGDDEKYGFVMLEGENDVDLDKERYEALRALLLATQPA